MSNPFPPVEDYFKLGKIQKSHGTAGKLRVRVEHEFEAYLKKNAYVFIDFDGSPVPFRINSFETDGHPVLSLEDVLGKDHSDVLSGKDISIPLDKLKPKHQHHQLHQEDEMHGYEIIDLPSGKTMQVLRTEELPQQLMAVVLIENNERYIPLHDSLINRWDHAGKKIEMNLPEGLLEL